MKAILAKASFYASLLLALLSGRLLAEETAKQQAEESARKWVRVERNDQGTAIAMQTAVVRYTGKSGDSDVEVDLIGAIHIGDRAYYEKLNKEFQQYDVLLFELVAPKGVKLTQGRGTSNAHPVGAMQNGMKNMLELEHQLELIDYAAKNFVHADMSPDEFAKSMSDRNESFLQMFFRMLGQGIAQQSKQQASGQPASDLNLLLALFDKNRALKLKQIMANQFESMESMVVSLGGPDGSTIITERNKVALKVLKKQLAAGKKKIGIFYGAGHMDDMDKRLRKDFELSPGETRWVTAWNLKQ